MNNQKIGTFISELRKSNQMTQKELASKLHVTDKAVSKWERGLSCPDIALLSPLAEIFQVTTGELLNGEKSKTESADIEADIDNALQYADKAVKSRAKSMQNIGAWSFSVFLLIGILVCTICDVAITGTFTWSPIPISSVVFAWLVLFPVVKLGGKGIWIALLALSVFNIPYLWVLNLLVSSGNLLMPVGICVTLISVPFLWIVFALFKKLKQRRQLAGAITLLLAIPLLLLINFSLSKIISEMPIDIWDILGILIFVVAAVLLFALDSSARKKNG